MKHGFIPFMRAHGQKPGPGQRPKTAGALAGCAAGMLAVPTLELSGAADSLRLALAFGRWQVPLLGICIAVLGGALYGAVFQRAAGDRRGGWLFGISYGFLLWMLGPVTLLQILHGRPLATGSAAMGVLAAHLVAGLVLGLLFRPAQQFVRRYLEHRTRIGTEVSRPPVEQIYGH